MVRTGFVVNGVEWQRFFEREVGNFWKIIFDIFKVLTLLIKISLIRWKSNACSKNRIIFNSLVRFLPLGHWCSYSKFVIKHLALVKTWICILHSQSVNSPIIYLNIPHLFCKTNHSVLSFSDHKNSLILMLQQKSIFEIKISSFILK